MIERLNFYDVYGYLLPGFGLLAIIWFPFWFVAGYELPAAWTSALVVIVLAYLAGHALSRLSTLAFPHGRVDRVPAASSTRPAPAAKLRSPSDYLLDCSDTTLLKSVKTALGALIRLRFGIDVLGPDEMPEEKDKRETLEQALTKQRNTAFMLCRRALLQHKVGSYAEQFEGLYTLLRGWTAVAWMAVAYNLGWVAGGLVPRIVPGWIPGAGAVAAGAAVIGYGVCDYRRERDVRRLRKPSVQYAPWGFRFVSLALFFLGALFEWHVYPMSGLRPSSAYTLVGVAAIAVLLGLRFHSGYHYFAGYFAETVYRDFYVLERYQSKAAGAGRDE